LAISCKSYDRVTLRTRTDWNSMLAVMTVNVGYFMSVLAGVLIGELIFGRFNQAVAHM
jgi:hypothetical protein